MRCLSFFLLLVLTQSFAESIIGPIEKTTEELFMQTSLPNREEKEQMRMLFQQRANQNFIPQPFPPAPQESCEIFSPLMESEASAPSLNFKAISAKEVLSLPPNAAGAVGPTQYIAAAENNIIRSFNKKTGEKDGVLDGGTSDFFATVLQPGYYAVEPQIRYDRMSDRWFILMVGNKLNETKTNQILLAVAKGAITKTTVWNFYSFLPNSVTPPRSDPALVVTPTLAVDANAIYIGANLFNEYGFVNCDFFVIPKALLLSSGELHITAFRNLIDANPSVGPYTPHGVTNFDPNAKEGYLIGVDGAYFGRLMLRRISNPGSLTPELSPNIPIQVLSSAAVMKVPHKGNTQGETGYLEGVDGRLSNPHIRDNHLFTAHVISTNPQCVSTYLKQMTANGCRWYEIDLTHPARPSMIKAGTLCDPANVGINRRHFWVSSIMTNGLNTVCIGCTTAGEPYYVDAAYALRYATDPGNKMRKPVIYTNSQWDYSPFIDPGGMYGRLWGKYSDTSLDPEDNLTLWTIQAFCDGRGSWGLQVASIPAAPPPLITTCSPSRLAQNLASAELTITGKTTEGSAFYDPPADFRKHLTVSIEDLQVLSVKVESPGKLKVKVSTMGSAKGSKSIAIRNPDDQEQRVTNLLTID